MIAYLGDVPQPRQTKMENIHKPDVIQQPVTQPDNSKANFDLHEILNSRPGVKPKDEAQPPVKKQEPIKSQADDLREKFPGIISSPFIVKDPKGGLTQAEKEAIAQRNRKPVRDNFTGQ